MDKRNLRLTVFAVFFGVSIYALMVLLFSWDDRFDQWGGSVTDIHLASGIGVVNFLLTACLIGFSKLSVKGAIIPLGIFSICGGFVGAYSSFTQFDQTDVAYNLPIGFLSSGGALVGGLLLGWMIRSFRGLQR